MKQSSLSRAAKSPPVARSAGNDQVHGLRALALLVRLDVEADLLSFVQTFKSSRFHGGDVHEHIAPAVIRLHEAVAAFTVEELHNTGLRHRENSSPRTAPPPAPTTGGGTYLPMKELHTNWGRLERGHGPHRAACGAPRVSQSSLQTPLPCRPRMPASAGIRTESSLSRVQGGLTRIRPQPLRRVGSLSGAAVSSARNIFAMPGRRRLLANASGSLRPLIGYQSA